MKTCLMTGATGLIGARLLTMLRKEWDVLAVVRDGKKPENSADVVQVDLGTEWDASALPPSVDAVVHLAQSEQYRDFPASAEQILRVNTVSTVRLLDYARRVGARTFVLASTGGVYGSGSRAFVETEPPSVDGVRGDLAFYLRTRRAAESFAATFEPFLSIAVLRFFFVYGPGQKETMLLPRLVRMVREDKPVVLQGPDGIRLNPVHVDDAARATGAALALGRSEIVNVAGPDVLTMREVGTAIGRALGKTPSFRQENGAPSDMVADIAKMSALLGGPAIRFADGIRTLV